MAASARPHGSPRAIDAGTAGFGRAARIVSRVLLFVEGNRQLRHRKLESGYERMDEVVRPVPGSIEGSEF
ncbi:hypothetical protein A20C1_07583 [marine actinobacterium PHSC20C1]|nr:hypothetical protein A20C1_07583 [marine actinobacterium PHSC20C1]